MPFNLIGMTAGIYERASGSVVALAVARLPANVRSPVMATLVSHRVLRPVCVGVCVCVCGGVRVSQYGVFRDYSGSFVCDESGQRGRLKFLDDSLALLGAFKKKIYHTRKHAQQ